MNIKRSIAKRIDRIFGSKEVRPVEKPIVNYYKTSYDKNVLICYIISPFTGPNNFSHQNYLTSFLIAECFSEQGYNVDIIDYQGEFDVDYDSYSVIFGFGPSFERSFYSKNRKIPRIHFITGAHSDLQNSMSLQSVKDFYDISGLWLPVEAKVMSVNCYYAMFNSDASIILAYGFVFDDHRSRVANRLYSLNNNILGAFNGFSPKNRETRNRNFLYLSGAYQVTKGLHILLEVARLRKDLNFYIVVFFVDEVLNRYYYDLLMNSPNIFLHKNVRMDSAEMKQIVEDCSYCIAPSYVDGLPGGTIEPMAAGLIPIVSKYCGFPRNNFIFEMEELSINGLNDTIDKVINLEDDTYESFSDMARNYAQENCSVANVKKDFSSILEKEGL